MQAYACSCIYIPSSPYNVCLTAVWTNVGHLTRVMQWVLAANQGFIQGFSLGEAANTDDLLLTMPPVSLSLRRISGLAWICHTVSWQQANWEKNIHFINFTFLGKCRGPHSPPPPPLVPGLYKIHLIMRTLVCLSHKTVWHCGMIHQLGIILTLVHIVLASG